MTIQQSRSDNKIRYQRPEGIYPWSKGAGTENVGTVWISMTPRKILDQFSKGAGDIATTELNEEFLFLAPLALNENIVHHWEAYESVASRLAQKVRSAVKLGAEGAALLGIYENSANIADSVKNTFKNKGGNVGRAIEQAVSATYGAVAGTRIPKIKVDTPLYYTNSDRRQIILEFQLFHENIGNAPEDVLIKPIQKLMKYSSPALLSDIHIEFPYMWSIKTTPNEFIKYTTCALVGVQPTWQSPYIQHVPASVNLQLTFLDMSPLYRDTIESGSIIRIISKEQADARNASNRLTTGTANIQNALSGNKKPAGVAQPNVHRIDIRH